MIFFFFVEFEGFYEYMHCRGVGDWIKHIIRYLTTKYARLNT